MCEKISPLKGTCISVFLNHVALQYSHFFSQCATKIVSDSPCLVDFAIGLVNSVFNLPDKQVMVFEEFE